MTIQTDTIARKMPGVWQYSLTHGALLVAWHDVAWCSPVESSERVSGQDVFDFPQATKICCFCRRMCQKKISLLVISAIITDRASG